jgi:hypothetical protein
MKYIGARRQEFLPLAVQLARRRCVLLGGYRVWRKPAGDAGRQWPAHGARLIHNNGHAKRMYDGGMAIIGGYARLKRQSGLIATNKVVFGGSMISVLKRTGQWPSGFGGDKAWSLHARA